MILPPPSNAYGVKYMVIFLKIAQYRYRSLMETEDVIRPPTVTIPGKDPIIQIPDAAIAT